MDSRDYMVMSEYIKKLAAIKAKECTDEIDNELMMLSSIFPEELKAIDLKEAFSEKPEFANFIYKGISLEVSHEQ